MPCVRDFCPCYFCDLERHDVQVCDVRVRKDKSKDWHTQFPIDSPCYNREVTLALCALVCDFTRQFKIFKRGQCTSRKLEGRWRATIECIVSNRVWKVSYSVRKGAEGYHGRLRGRPFLTIPFTSVEDLFRSPRIIDSFSVNLSSIAGSVKHPARPRRRRPDLFL